MIQLILSIIAFLYGNFGLLFFLFGAVKLSFITTEQRLKSLDIALKLEIVTLVALVLRLMITKI